MSFCRPRFGGAFLVSEKERVNNIEKDYFSDPDTDAGGNSVRGYTEHCPREFICHVCCSSGGFGFRGDNFNRNSVR